MATLAEDFGAEEEGHSEGTEEEYHLKGDDNGPGGDKLTDELEHYRRLGAQVPWEGVGCGAEDEVRVVHHDDFEDVEEEIADDEFR